MLGPNEAAGGSRTDTEVLKAADSLPKSPSTAMEAPSS